MKLRQVTQIFCFLVVVHCSIGNVSAISFDEIFDYFLDGLDESDESQEFTNTNLNVTCKNCNVTVECQNCTQSHKDTQSTIPMQTEAQNNQQVTTSSLPAPTIPAPERVVEIISSENVPSESAATPSQNLSATITTAAPSSATTNTKADTSSATDDATNLTADEMSSPSDGVTGGSELTTN